MIHHKISQNTSDWDELRSGKFTASTFGDLFSKPTSQTYQNQIARVIAENLAGCTDTAPTSYYMQRGHDLEPFAAEEYKKINYLQDNQILDGGFWEYNSFVGASPDRLIGQDGLLEIKCLSMSNHIKFKLFDGIKKDKQKYWQVQGQMMCTGRQWCDLFFYHPKIESHTIRFERDEDELLILQQTLEAAVNHVKRSIKNATNPN